jgi:formate hydrogenlyase subunit 4
MFETLVGQLVKVELTNETVRTEWYNGTLFVSTITESQARQVFHRLSRTFGVGAVEIHAIGDTGEYAYDFVAAPAEVYSPYETVNS